MTEVSGAGEEERRQPGLDIVRDFLGGAILGVAEGAGSGRSAGSCRECRRRRARTSCRSSPICWWRSRSDCIAHRCRKFSLVGSAVVGSIISDERLVREADHQPVGRRHAGGVAVELERQRIADFHPEPRLARGVGLVDRRQFHRPSAFRAGRACRRHVRHTSAGSSRPSAPPGRPRPEAGRRCGS